MKILLPVLGGILFTLAASGQDKTDAKFGKVNPEDFKKVYSIDSNANAVVIADVGSSQIIGNLKGWFSLQYKRYCRVQLLNKNGFDVASQEIPLWSSTSGDDEEKLTEIKAVTYNVENGKVVETKLDTKANVFRDKINKNLVVKKFTFPNIKEGSIIEFQYTIESDYLQNLQPWAFQGSYPVLWSEYDLRLPQFFRYLFLSQGYQKFFISTQNNRQDNFSVTEDRGTSTPDRFSFSAGVTDYRWVIKDAPALKEEGYVSTVKNHIQKLEFELSAQSEPLRDHIYLDNWMQASEKLMEDEDFGLPLTKDNGWLGDIIKPLIAGAQTPTEKARRIYTFVRDNFTCTDFSEKWLGQSLKAVAKSKNGSDADINMLLIAMLRYADIEANPVILSTTSHGYIYALYPILSRFNYVICEANLDGLHTYLDATHPRLGFGKLPTNCYNGDAKIISSTYGNDVVFSPDSLVEKKMTSILVNTNDKGELIATMQQLPGYYESLKIRDKIKEKGKDEFFKEIQKSYGQDVTMDNKAIDSLNDLDEGVKISYDMQLNQGHEDMIYINPMFSEGYKENPFKSAERYYPVEMPYTTDETYVFNMFVPDGYDVDEIPKTLIVKLNEQGDGQFEYQISQSGNIISLRTRIYLKRTFFAPEEYDMLREFFNMVVKKQSEQIVLKKKK